MGKIMIQKPANSSTGHYSTDFGGPGSNVVAGFEGKL